MLFFFARGLRKLTRQLPVRDVVGVDQGLLIDNLIVDNHVVWR